MENLIIKTIVCFLIAIGFANILLLLGFQLYKRISDFSIQNVRLKGWKQTYTDIIDRQTEKYKRLLSITYKAAENIESEKIRQEVLKTLEKEGLIYIN